MLTIGTAVMRPVSSPASSAFMKRTTAAIDEYSPPWIPPSRQRCGPSRAPAASKHGSSSPASSSWSNLIVRRSIIRPRAPRPRPRERARPASPSTRSGTRRRAPAGRPGEQRGSSVEQSGSCGDGAARVEAAAARQADRARRVADHAPRLSKLGRARASAPPQQPLRVRMPRVREELLGRRGLDDPAEVHHRDPVADVPHDGHVVRDQQHGQAQLRAQLREQVQHRRLDRDVERRHRLVGDQHARARARARARSRRAAAGRPRTDADGRRARAARRPTSSSSSRQRASIRAFGTIPCARSNSDERLLAPSSAGSATSTDPGTPSGSAGARRARGCASAPRPRSGSRLRSARRGRRCSGRASTCRSPTRRRARASRPARARGRRRRPRAAPPRPLAADAAPSPPRSSKCIGRPRTSSSGSGIGDHRLAPHVGGATSIVDAGTSPRAAAEQRAAGTRPARQSVLRERAARMEAAARRRRRRGRAARRGSTRERSRTSSTSGTERSRPSVYGCRGSRKTVVDGARLDDLARVHHGDAPAGLRDHREVVRDEDEADAELARAATRAASGSDPGS